MADSSERCTSSGGFRGPLAWHLLMLSRIVLNQPVFKHKRLLGLPCLWGKWPGVHVLGRLPRKPLKQNRSWLCRHRHTPPPSRTVGLSLGGLRPTIFPSARKGSCTCSLPACTCDAQQEAINAAFQPPRVHPIDERARGEMFPTVEQAMSCLEKQQQRK